MMNRSSLALVAGLAAALGVTACGKSAPTSSDGSKAPATSELSPTTPAPKGDYAKPVVWATYREVGTLDPIQAFDYPENTVDTALCDSLLRQEPDGTITAGLATPSNPDDRTLVLTLKSGPKFWNGRVLTADDVVWNLKRAADPDAGGFYPAVFTNVSSIVATSPTVVTVKLKQPDYWLNGELSQMPGIVVEKAFGEKAGKKLGTPGTGTMCTGPYKLQGWTPGKQLTAVANKSYWDGEHTPKVSEIQFKGVPDEASLTSGLLTGEIDGTYPQPLSTLQQLKNSSRLKVTTGPSFASDALVISNLKGAFSDVRVRQAISMAIDRKAYISAIYHGEAQLPRTLANPGTWGYGKDVFQADWDKRKDPALDVAKAKSMVKAAGAAGKTITLGTTSEVASLNAAANAVRQAAVSIGLKARLKSVSAANYINFFTDAKAREGIDGFPTVNYPDYADPAAFYNTFVAEGGTQNYDGFSNAAITKAMDAARRTADADERAKLVAQAGGLIQEQLPWIPLAAPNTVLITNKALTGAPSSFVYMGGPWVNLMGAS